MLVFRGYLSLCDAPIQSCMQFDNQAVACCSLSDLHLLKSKFKARKRSVSLERV